MKQISWVDSSQERNAILCLRQVEKIEGEGESASIKTFLETLVSKENTLFTPYEKINT